MSSTSWLAIVCCAMCTESCLVSNFKSDTTMMLEQPTGIAFCEVVMFYMELDLLAVLSLRVQPVGLVRMEFSFKLSA